MPKYEVRNIRDPKTNKLVESRLYPVDAIAKKEFKNAGVEYEILGENKHSESEIVQAHLQQVDQQKGVVN